MGIEKKFRELTFLNPKSILFSEKKQYFCTQKVKPLKPTKIMPHRKIYEVVVCDTEGNAIDSVYFNSHKAAKTYKPEYGHTTLICEWPLFTIKDIK